MILDVLPPIQQKLAKKLNPTVRQFYLAGGTALALQLGHRESVDFDFFSGKRFAAEKLLNVLTDHGLNATVIQEEKNTLTCIIDEVKVSFFGEYRFKTVKPLKITPYFSLASLEDIFAMKLLAIQHRSEVKDYIDIFFLIRGGIPLQQGILLAQKKFGPTFNPVLSIKALCYFDDFGNKELSSICFTKGNSISFACLKRELSTAATKIIL